MNLIEGAGVFIYPLGLCSFLALFIMIERLIALRTIKIVPADIDTLNQLELNNSVAGRVMIYHKEQNPDAKNLKAFARYELARLERGFFVLDVIIAAAPLIGLLGTVVGLIQVFSNIAPESGMPDPAVFVQGISLALTTTMLGLVIAIPVIFGNSYLNRRIEMFAAKLEMLIERLVR